MPRAAEALVVGGGPAGSATALLLARAGTDVTIVERARFPRQKACGEYLAAGALEALRRLGVADEIERAGTPLRGVRVVPHGGPPVALDFPGGALALARERLDAILLARALEAGAHLIHARAEDVIVREGRACGVVLRDESGQSAAIEARWIVGADGVGSLVARKLGLARAPRRNGRFALGGHYRGLGPFDGYVEMYAGARAYFALNPLDGERTNVMVVVPRDRLATWSRAVEERMGEAAISLARGARDLTGGERVSARIAVGPLQQRTRARWAPGALLVGDAGGFLDPFTGQGVYLALSGAQRAADALLAVRGGEPEDRAFRAYDRERREDFARRRRLARAVNGMIRTPWLARRVAARLGRDGASARALLESLTGMRPLPGIARSTSLVWRLVR